eukprot:3697242-Prymnesium_polylepis.2
MLGEVQPFSIRTTAAFSLVKRIAREDELCGVGVARGVPEQLFVADAIGLQLVLRLVCLTVDSPHSHVEGIWHGFFEPPLYRLRIRICRREQLAFEVKAEVWARW